MDAQRLSALDFERLKNSRRAAPTLSAFQRVATEWRRPSPNWQQTLRWTWVAIAGEARNWHAAVPALFRGDFLFTLGLWVAVFSVTASVMALPSVPVRVRYGSALAAVAYLYLYAQLARVRRLIPGRRVLLTVADATVIVTLAMLSAPYAGYAHLLLFFGVARIATRFQEVWVVPAGLILLVPFDGPSHAPLLAIVFDAFAVLMLMLVVQQMHLATVAAQRRVDQQGALASLISCLGRARDQDALFGQLASLVLPLAPRCAWAFWAKDPTSDDVRPVRWVGLGDEDRPAPTFTPALGPDRAEPVLITGPLPGTAFGRETILQPLSADSDLMGLITVAGQPEDLDAATRSLVRTIGEETAIALARLQAVDDQRHRTEAMEQANRLAGLAARHAADPAGALAALLPAATETLRVHSLLLQWVEGDSLRLVVGNGDPLVGYVPDRIALAGTRTTDAITQARVIKEPLTGRRPEDIFGAPAGLRQVAVAPLRTAAGVEGALQAGRREARAFSSSETLVLQLLAERLGLLLAGGQEPVSGGQGRVLREA